MIRVDSLSLSKAGLNILRCGGPRRCAGPLRRAKWSTNESVLVHLDISLPIVEQNEGEGGEEETKEQTKEEMKEDVTRAQDGQSSRAPGPLWNC